MGDSKANIYTTQRNTRYSHATTLRPAPQQPKTHVFNHLPAAGGHTRGSTDTSPLAASDNAHQPAGHHSRTDQELGLPPTQSPTPTLYFITSALGTGSPRPRPCPQARDAAAPRPPSAPSRPRRHHRESTIWLKSPPPTPYTCNTATQRLTTILSAMARWLEVPRTLLHQSGSL